MRYQFVPMTLVIGAGALLPALSLAATDPTDVEQYELELLNRARANPTQEVSRLSSMTWGDDPNQVPSTQFPQPQTPGLNEGLSGSPISTDPKPPLAFNRNLEQSARDYAGQLIAASQFTHNLGDPPTFTPDNPSNTPGSRMAAAGYTFGGTSGSSEDLAASGGTGSESITGPMALGHHNGLFVDSNTVGRGHRTTMMNGTLREVGIGIAQGNTTIFGSSLPTGISVQDFAFTTGNPFLTGVVFRDNVTVDNFYTPGEGIGGVTVTATPSVGQAQNATTFGSGGYSLQLAAGTYDVTFSGPGGLFFNAGPITIGADNVKVDAINPVPEPTSVCSLLGIGAVGLLGRRRRSVGR